MLVGLDGPQLADRARSAGIELAERLGSPIRLMRVVSAGSAAVLVGADPARALLEAAAREKTAVVCLATRAGGGPPFGLGAVAYEVLSRCDRPVVFAGPVLGYPEGLAWEGEPVSLERFRGGGVVACVDGGDDSPALVAAAAEWAGILGETLIVLTVYEADIPLIEGVADRAFGPRADVEAVLDALAGPVRERGLKVRCRAIPDPVGVVEGLHDYLQKSPPALLVLGCRLQRGRIWSHGAKKAAAILRRSPSLSLIRPRS